MQPKEKKSRFDSSDIAKILKKDYAGLMSSFYEMQSSFMSSRYKLHGSLETSCIILCLTRSIHLEIVRQREKNLDYDFSLDNFWFNLNSINKPGEKIVKIVEKTGIPKETVRRKIKTLLLTEEISVNIDKEYYWTLLPKRREEFINMMSADISNISTFIHGLTKNLNLNISKKEIQNEIKSKFSFFWFHFLTCQLKWLKMWQNKIKDLDLVLITLQALIPTLQNIEKNKIYSDVKLENIYLLVGKVSENESSKLPSIGATSVAEVTGIPRATCIRKLGKLIKLGLLVKETKTKRYYVNQSTSLRTKHIITKDAVTSTIDIFGEYLSIIINALTKKYI